MAPPWRTALVTGASSGIGRALALELCRAGVKVTAAARRVALLESLVAESEAAGGGTGSIEALPLDVGQTEATVESLRALDRRQGGLDLVVACAGVGIADRSVPGHAWEAIGPAFHTNFCGAAATLTAVLPQMVDRRRGHLAAISSLAAFGALPGAAAYCAPKAGLDMLLDCLRLDLAGSGVAVTTVHLGFVRTAMTAASTHPMPQLLEVDDAAARIVRGLRGAPAHLQLPEPLALATRIFGLLPGRGRLLRALGVS